MTQNTKNCPLPLPYILKNCQPLQMPFTFVLYFELWASQISSPSLLTRTAQCFSPNPGDDIWEAFDLTLQ